MGIFLSPGVNVSEKDASSTVPGVGTTTGAIAGPFRWGPGNQRMLIDAELTLINTFGKPDSNCANTWFTAANFLAYGSALQVVRALRAGVGGHMNATADGAGLLIANQDSYLAQFANGQGDVGMFAAKYPGDLGNSLLVSVADSQSYAGWKYANSFTGAPGTSDFVKASGGSNDELHVVVVDALGYFTGVQGTVLETFPYLSKAATAKSADGSTIYYAEVLNRKSKYIYWMDHPTGAQIGTADPVNWGGVETTAFQGSSTAITVTGAAGTFTPGETVTSAISAAITPAGSGATATATISTGAITAIPVTDGGSGYTTPPAVTITGDGTGATATATVSGGKVTGVTVNAGGTGYTTATVSFVSPGTGATASVAVSSSGIVTGVTPVDPGSGYTAPPTVTINGAGSGAQVTAVLGTGATAGQVVGYTVVKGGTGYIPVTATVLTVAGTNLTVAPTAGTIADGLVLTGGTSGATATIATVTGGPITLTLAGGVDANSALQDGDYELGYDQFASTGDVDVSLILGADASANLAAYLITNLAEVRKDCVAFISPPLAAVLNNQGNEATDIVNFRNLLPSSSYAFMDSGWKYQYDKYSDIYRWCPLNGDIAGLCVATDATRDPWWSPAGYTRGVIKNTVKLAWNPRQAYRDVIYNAGVNPVITQPGSSPILYGDKTMQSKPSAFDRINVRRLFIVLEKAVSDAAKYSLFEFNDAYTRAQFVALVTPYLRDVKGRRGISDFQVVCDATNNTGEVIDSNQFVGDIYVKPAHSINFIQLNFVAVRTDVQFSEIVGQA